MTNETMRQIMESLTISETWEEDNPNDPAEIKRLKQMGKDYREETPPEGFSKEDEVKTPGLRADPSRPAYIKKNDLEEVDEAVGNWAQPTRYEFDDDQTGDSYLLEYQDRNGEEVGFVEINGVAAATFTLGGAGAMDTKIQDADDLMNMIATLMRDK